MVEARRRCPTLVYMINARPEIALRVLIAIEPRAYSQTIDYTIQALRSRYAVRTVDPARLGDEVERGTTDLVLCSMPPVALGEGLTWVEFRPYAEPGNTSVTTTGNQG
jgi:hypothetical protein